MFPGLLRPTYSEEEYLSVVEREASMLKWLFICVSVISFAFAFAIVFVVLKYLTQ